MTVELGQGAERRDPLEELAEPLARELPRLVETDVDAPAREQRKQLAEQLAHERQRTGIGGIEGHRFVPEPVRIDESVGRDRE